MVDENVTYPHISELSASETSNAFANTLVTDFNVNTFKISSSHMGEGPFATSPFTTGINILSGSVEIINDSPISKITLDSPATLFITASSPTSGGYANPLYYSAQYSQSAITLPSPILEGNFNIGDITYNIEYIDGNNFIIDTPLLKINQTNQPT